MPTISSLIVLVQAKTEQFQAGMAKAEATTASTTSGISKFGGVASLAIAGAGLAAVKFAETSVQAFQSVAGDTRMLEKQLGITAEQASVLRAQAEALGVPVDKLSIGFGLFAKHLVAGDDVLKQYGIDVVKTADGSIDFQAILGQLSTKFNEMGPGVERTAASMNLFGRSGKSLLPLLSSNSDELARLAKSAKDAGLIMSEDDVQAARALGIAQRQLGESVKGLEVNIGRALVPSLTELADSLTKTMDILRPLLTSAFEGVTRDAVILAEGIENISNKFHDLLGIIPGASDGFKLFGFSITGTFHALQTLANPLESIVHPIGRFQTAWQQARGETDDAAAAQEAAARTMDDIVISADDASISLRTIAKAQREAADAAREHRLAILAETNSFLGILDSADQVSAAQNKLNQLQKNGKEGTQAYKDAVLEAIKAQAGLEGAVLEYAKELADSGDTQKQVINKVQDLARNFGLQKDDVSGLIGEVKSYISALGGIPSHISTTANLVFTGGGVTHAQHGFHGVVTGPKLFLAGEAGVERVDIGPGGGGGMTIVNHFHGDVTGEEIVRKVRDGLLKLKARNATTGL
jgi:hypothetical protein